MNKQVNVPYALGSELLTEKEKDTEAYFISMVDAIIRELNYDKKLVKQQYAYYNGIRSSDKFCALTENEGIGAPFDVPFISLIRPRLRALIGIQLNHPFNYKITCNGDFAYTEIEEEKKIFLLNEYFSQINKDLQKNLAYLGNIKPEAQQGQQADTHYYTLYENALKNIKFDYADDFVSTLEIEAQHILNHMIAELRLPHKIADLFEHLLIAGSAYYKVTIQELGFLPELEILNPVNFYHVKHNIKENVSSSSRAFYRKWMTKTEIMNSFGHELSDEEREDLDGTLNTFAYSADIYWSPEIEAQMASTNSVDVVNVHTYGMNFYEYQWRYYPVYYCEWLANNKIKWTNPLTNEEEERFQLDRYEGIRIGDAHGLYLRMRKSPYVVRNMDNPYKCFLSFGGVYKGNENDYRPESMVRDLMEIQDASDIAYYLRKRVESQVFPAGIQVDIATLPAFLGSNTFERVSKMLAYMKQGFKLIDSIQEGVAAGGQYGGINNYPASVNSDLVGVFASTIELCEQDADKVTGVNRQMLGQMEQRDGLGVTKQSLVQTSLITKSWFNTLDLCINFLLTDLIEASRISCVEGRKYQYIHSGKNKLFSISNKFKLASYSVFVTDKDAIYKDEETLRQVGMQFAQSGQLDPVSILEILASKSVTEVSSSIKNRLNDKTKQEMDSMKSQLEQLGKENADLKKQVENIDQEELKRKQKELQLKEQEILAKIQEAKDDLAFKYKELEAKMAEVSKRTELEKLQIIADPKAKEVVDLNL